MPCRLAIVFGLVFLSGCGYIGEPLYPALNIPARVIDLAAVERGDKLEISFTIPPLTTEGLTIKTIGKIDLRAGPAPEGGFQADRWAEHARAVPVSSPDKPQAVQATTAAPEFVGKEVIIGVRIANAKGRYSAWSNLATVAIETPLAAPANFTVEGVPEGILLRWNQPPPAAAGTKTRIFRKVEDQPIAALETVDETQYIDKTSEYGKTYTYYVQAIHNKTESDVSEAMPIETKDTFAPAVPAGLTASAAVSSIELAWERNTESDLKGYRIYRAVGDGPFSVLSEVDVPSYSDTAVEPGKRYRYRVTAFDQIPNESAPSAEASATLP